MLFFLHVLCFNRHHFVEAADEALFLDFEFGIEERINDLKCDSRADDARAKNHHVHVVVFNSLMRGIGFLAHAGTNAGDFVGSNANTNAGAADKNSSLGLAGIDGVANTLSKIRVIRWLGIECAKVDNFMALLCQVGTNFLFQSESCVV